MNNLIKMELPKEKQTTLGLYVTSKEAYELWKSSPDTVKILDVRTLDEYIYVGHAEMAMNIPGFLQTYQWDAEKKHFSFIMNPDFVKHVTAIYQPNDTIFITCRSGGRSALAVNLMATLGYKNVYNITDGFEGDTVNDDESAYNGKRLKNGWINAGVPWTYKVDVALTRVPAER